MKVYISAPITGREETAESRFKEAEELLIRNGHEPVNPYEQNKGYKTWEDAMMACLRLLRKCDAIMLCDGWNYSRGCQMERLFASGSDKHYTIIFEEGLKD